MKKVDKKTPDAFNQTPDIFPNNKNVSKPNVPTASISINHLCIDFLFDFLQGCKNVFEVKEIKIHLKLLGKIMPFIKTLIENSAFLQNLIHNPQVITTIINSVKHFKDFLKIIKFCVIIIELPISQINFLQILLFSKETKENVVKKICKNKKIKFKSLKKDEKNYDYLFEFLPFLQIEAPLLGKDAIAQDIAIRRFLKLSKSTLFFVSSICSMIKFSNKKKIFSIPHLRTFSTIENSLLIIYFAITIFTSLIECFNILFIRDFSFYNCKKFSKEIISIIKNIALLVISIISIIIIFSSVPILRKISAIMSLSTFVVSISSLLFDNLIFNPFYNLLEKTNIPSYVEKYIFNNINVKRRKIRGKCLEKLTEFVKTL